MQHTKQTIVKRLLALGFDPGRAGHLAAFIWKQIECRGPYGAVDVLKRYSLYLKQLLEGGDSPNPAYIRVGSAGFPIKLSYCRRLPRELHHVLYSLHRFVFIPEQSQVQKDEMVATVHSEPLPVDSSLLELIRKGCETLPKLVWNTYQTPVALLAYRRVCEFNEGDDLWAKARRRLRREYGMYKKLPYDIQKHSGWAKAFPGISTRVRAKMDFLLGKSWLPDCDQPVGSFKVEPEPGGKFRLSASPYLLYQSVSEPLYRTLMGCLSRLGQDCTYDQDAGPVRIQQWLAEERTVYSYDLSSATDLFPLYLQRHLLNQLGVSEEDRAIFEHVSRGRFVGWQEGYQSLVLQWNRGQPLGFKPSFATFALTHHALIRGLAVTVGTPLDYLVLGDDVVIGDDKLAAAYAAVMADLGILNPAKGLVSSRSAEFASRIVTREQTYRTGKHRMVDDSNLESMINLYGERAVLVAETPLQKAVTRWLIGAESGLEEAMAKFHDQATTVADEADCTTPQGIVERLSFDFPPSGELSLDHRLMDDYLREKLRPIAPVSHMLSTRKGLTHVLYHLYLISRSGTDTPVLRQVCDDFGLVNRSEVRRQRKLLSDLVPWSVRLKKLPRASVLRRLIERCVRETTGVKNVILLKDGTVRPVLPTQAG